MLVKHLYLTSIWVWREWEAIPPFEEYMALLVLLLRGLNLGFCSRVKHLEEDAPESPHVRSLVVLALDQRDFGCAVPPGSDMARKGPFLILRLVLTL